jgi:CubicO group peptidase (beta-lactamase class C family)
MADLNKRLQSIVATIEEILKLSSSAGASVGVAVNGKAVFKENFGFRDHWRSKRADSDTLYSIGSLTKSMTAAAAGIAVSQGSLKWESRICDILPNFRPSNRYLAENCTIADLLCHRSGLPGANTLWYQGGSEPLVAKKDIVPMINSMPAIFDLRSSWGYSN